MSQQNVDVARRIFDSRSRGGFSVGKDLLTGDFEWRQHAEVVESGRRRGAEALEALEAVGLSG